MKALLICMQGMSTAIMEKKIKEAAIKKEVEIDLKAIPNNAFKSVGNLDIIILGPQLRYATEDIEKKIKAEGKNIPIYIIEPQDYGMMRGDIVLNRVLEVLGK